MFKTTHRAMSALAIAAALAAVHGVTAAQTLNANATANNGGSAGWAAYFDVTASQALAITGLTTASTAAAGASFSVEVLTHAGSALGATGANGSPAGWTSLGTATATQGAAGSGISLLIDIPDILLAAGQTTGIALVFGGAGPRYFGSGTAPLQTFADSFLTLVTGDARSVPFSTGGSYFSSRGLTGSLVYAPVPEPATWAMAAMGIAGLALRLRRRVG